MSNALRRLLKLPITLPLGIGAIRRRVAFEMRPWFADMLFEIPLTDGLACPIGHWDAAHSFSEIFVGNEYGALLETAPLPRRWLDLGCHAGYFTLYLAWKNAQAGRAKEWSALMIDADPRKEPLVRWTLRRNGLEGCGRFQLGMISAKTGEQEFALRQGMVSSANVAGAPVEEIRRVPCLSGAQIAEMFPPPYDLIKIDIEGAEYDFARSYPDLCRQAAWILVEWHSPNREGSGASEMRGLCEANGFEYVREVRPRHELLVDGAWHSSGVQLYRGKAAHEIADR